MTDNQVLNSIVTFAAVRSKAAAILWWLMALSCIGVAVYSLQYFVFTPHDDHFALHISMLRVHIIGGMVAILAGPWQFSGRLRARALNVHRWLGRTYLVGVLLGSVAGFGMATVSREGIPTHLGFGVLSVFWLFTSARAYLAVRRGRIAGHRRWMIRSFALTLAAVTLRNYLPLMLFGLHWSFRSAYITVSWLCWVPNLIVAEWIVRRERPVEIPEVWRRDRSSLVSSLDRAAPS